MPKNNAYNTKLKLHETVAMAIFHTRSQVSSSAARSQSIGFQLTSSVSTNTKSVMKQVHLSHSDSYINVAENRHIYTVVHKKTGQQTYVNNFALVNVFLEDEHVGRHKSHCQQKFLQHNVPVILSIYVSRHPQISVQCIPVLKFPQTPL